METREITVIATNKNAKYVINTAAENLAELKDALTVNNIDFTNMDFIECLTKTELKSDESPLPKDVVYKGGEPTNNLVFCLVSTKKKIESGVSRLHIYGIIRKKNLANEVKDVFGKNFTNVSTTALTEFLKKAEKEHKREQEEKKDTVNTSTAYCMVEEKLNRLIEVLDEEAIVSKLGLEYIQNPCDFDNYNGKPSVYSDKELADIVDEAMDCI
jgi:hypothetical protein